MSKSLLCALLAISLVHGCATPVMPTGGPADKTPPALESSIPAAGSTNFEGSELQLIFAERLDAASIQRSLTVTPELDEPPEIKAKGRKVTVKLRSALLENTTYIFSFDKTLKDLRGVALDKPVIVAIATGPEIDEGKISGRVIDPKSDKGAEGFDILAFAFPDTAAAPTFEKAIYKTQSGADGSFEFSYLAEKPFFVLAVRDFNRNQSVDEREYFAVPPQERIVAREADSTAAGLVWYKTLSDTTAPDVSLVRTRSDRRVQIRFTESVMLLPFDPAHWSLTDSTSGAPVGVRGAYVWPESPAEVSVITDAMTATTHRLVTEGVADSSGNRLDSESIFFETTEREDTVQTRFVKWVPEPSSDSTTVQLNPGQWPGIELSQPMDASEFLSLISLRTDSGSQLEGSLESENGLVTRIRIPEWDPNDPLSIRLDGSGLGVDSVFSQRFLQYDPALSGEISGVALGRDSLVVELYSGSDQNRIPLKRVRVDSTGVWIAEGLAADAYRIRLLEDRNGDSDWSGGAVWPYSPPEAFMWHPDTVRVRAKWTTALEDTLRLSEGS